MRFIVDAQLPPALARMLAEHGHEVQHVVDLNFQAVDLSGFALGTSVEEDC